ncbi:hypothetical protein TUM20985_40030 [Mycobacterium antarcticum]|uniref:hypothetical protein n=1 Tax=unclassified Mycolicibacterium TaxID=2636767 RepID=UPI0023A465BE|nr:MULTISPECIES: hypothetical protein [unclassified Mycolicibacterium]BDX33456.1 hypothetical protein TUM20985_40030 [Mycolicibacterium sp. TUM20985]GLP82931.1 hypothetical protein TUM20984_43510 [Mycolicibacterium sp. TUM20984]
MNVEQAEARFERIIRPQAASLLERGVAGGALVIDDIETTLTMCFAGTFEVIRGIVDGRLPHGADLTCAEMLLGMAGWHPEHAPQSVRRAAADEKAEAPSAD